MNALSMKNIIGYLKTSESQNKKKLRGAVNSKILNISKQSKDPTKIFKKVYKYMSMIQGS